MSMLRDLQEVRFYKCGLFNLNWDTEFTPTCHVVSLNTVLTVSTDLLYLKISLKILFFKTIHTIDSKTLIK